MGNSRAVVQGHVVVHHRKPPSTTVFLKLYHGKKPRCKLLGFVCASCWNLCVQVAGIEKSCLENEKAALKGCFQNGSKDFYKLGLGFGGFVGVMASTKSLGKLFSPSLVL